ncbi:lipocalin family protein [Lewinella sp. IMCC34183]|uniref:lipocalin family protein n=1 Tax=Lewinella sp. IMCC34183 TaxID=2248762 RepID=UPI000E272C36|nr:lipocalin family protein [Lewinella sp. IMCC34183]
MKRYLPLLALALCLLHCGEPEPDLLVGEWQGSLVTEDGDSLRLDPREITFDFRPDNRYKFTSTLRYQEAGTWRYDDGYLFAQDTTQPANPERVVAVEALTLDSLVLRMRSDTAERLVTLLRTSAPPPQ